MNFKIINQTEAMTISVKADLIAALQVKTLMRSKRNSYLKASNLALKEFEQYILKRRKSKSLIYLKPWKIIMSKIFL